MSQPSAEQLTATLDKMIEAGWAESYSWTSGEEIVVKWTEKGTAAIKGAWSLMEDLGGARAPEDAWNSLGYLVHVRHYGSDWAPG
jgi:hypothetical protein